MSLVIQKFEPGGKPTQPRLYKRGNDDIDLDAYIRNAESEFSYWLANSRLKDKQKREVLEAFYTMLNGINEGTFTYRIGGGYNNTLNISNATKGFDAYGLAAGFLGNVLRSQSVYTAPEDPADASKIEWSGKNSIGTALNRYLYGSDTADTTDIIHFVDLDSYDATTKRRDNTQRSIKLKAGLEYIRDYFGNLFTSFSDNDRKTAIANIEEALEAFDNGTVEDNEYFALNRATGLSNLKDMFFSGETYGNSTPSSPSTTPGTVATTPEAVPTYHSEEEWRKAAHPRYTGTLTFNRSLDTSHLYKKEDRDRLAKALNTLTKDLLLKVIAVGITYSKTGLDLNKLPQIINEFGGAPSFDNNFILRGVVELCRIKDYLHLFGPNSNSFYIPFTSAKLDNKGTGVVYQIAGNGSRNLVEMDRNDIPYFQQAWHNEYLNSVPSNKKGGVLKFQNGGNTPPWYAGLTEYDPNRYTHSYNTTKLVDGDMSDGLFNPWTSNLAGQLSGFYDPTAGYGTLGVNNEHYNYAKRVEDLDYYKLFGQALLKEDGTPTDIGEAWMRAVDNLLPEDSLARFYDKNGNLRTSWTLQGTNANGIPRQSYRSLKDYINAIRNDLLLGARHNVFLKEGKRYFYKDDEGKIHWVDPNQIGDYQVSPNPTKQSWNEDHTVYWSDYELTGLNQETSDSGNVSSNPETSVNGEENTAQGASSNGNDNSEKKEQELAYLGETLLSNVTPKTRGFGNFLAGLTPDLIGSGRLWASLHTNNKVYDTVLPSLLPVLKDTYERYSPVTGAFSAMQLKNSQGAGVLSLSYRPFTSDASLAAARMLDGLRQANQLQTEGFLADNLEIRRTQGEALARQEDNMARRSEVANFNRASLNQTRRERAQLSATRLKSNWQSWDNFLQGLETRMRTRFEENRERANNFYDKLSVSQAEEWYNSVMEPANREYQAWQKAHSGEDPATNWGNNGESWNRYVRHTREARARANAMIYADMARRYGLSYNNPYSDESNAQFNWNISS